MVKVKLIAYNKPLTGSKDPRRLPLIGFKVSVGKLHDNPIDYYLSDEYPEEKIERILLSAVEFPSILEHVTFTFLIEDVSRVCSHQLVRHRLVSFTQESQRYSESYMKKAIKRIVNGVNREDFYKMYREKRISDIIDLFLSETIDSECKCIREDYCQILLETINEAFIIPEQISRVDSMCFARDLLLSIKRYYELVEKGVKYEDARFILPQAIKTRLLATLNLRELLHMACLRLSPKAQWEIREVVRKMIEEVREIIPEINDLIKGYCSKYGVR